MSAFAYVETLAGHAVRSWRTVRSEMRSTMVAALQDVVGDGCTLALGMGYSMFFKYLIT